MRDAQGAEGGAPVGELVGGLTGLEAGAERLVDRVVVAAEVVAVAGEHVQLVADRPAAVGMSKRLQASAYRATSLSVFRSPIPPINIGGRGLVSGRGALTGCSSR